MNLRRLLRSLIVTEIVLAVIYIAVELIAQRFLPAPLRAWVDQQVDQVGPVEIVAMLLAFPLLGALVFSWIGLWRLWRPARWVYLLAVVGGLLLEALMDRGSTAARGRHWTRCRA